MQKERRQQETRERGRGKGEESMAPEVALHGDSCDDVPLVVSV